MSEQRLINAVVLVDIETHRARYAEMPEKADAYRQVLWDIAHCATIDAVPVVHARWIDPCINKYGHPCHHCSACRFKASQKDRNYCPNCGAKMDGGASNA